MRVTRGHASPSPIPPTQEVPAGGCPASGGLAEPWWLKGKKPQFVPPEQDPRRNPLEYDDGAWM